MPGKVIAAGPCRCLQLMVRQCPSECFPGGLQCVVEPVSGIIHAVDPMDFTQAVFVEPRIMGYQRQTFYQWFYAAPNVRKYRSILGIVAIQSVDLAAEPAVVVRFRTDQAVEPVGDYTVMYGDYTDAISDLVANYLMPGGGRQLQRTIEGAQVMGGLPQLVTKTDEEGNKTKEWVKEPIYYTGSGKIGFVTDPTDMVDYATALLFGKWATDEGKEYIENDFKPASQTETKLFDNLNEGNATEAFNIAEETFEAKKEYSTREEFLGYLDNAPYNSKDKNEILDTYYGENKIVSNLNDFADQYGLDEDEMYQIKSYGLNQKGVLDDSGNNISNTKALNYRKQLTEMGLYDSLVKYIEKSGVAPADVGLTKTVYGMSDAEFESKYNYYFNSNGKTGIQASDSGSSYTASGRRTRQVRDKYHVSQKDFDKAIQSISNIYNKIQSKIYSSANNFFDIEIPSFDELKLDISKELKLDSSLDDIKKKYSSSMFDDLIDSYLEDHPYSNLFEGF